jgi:hypothetical protein
VPAPTTMKSYSPAAAPGFTVRSGWTMRLRGW